MLIQLVCSLISLNYALNTCDYNIKGFPMIFGKPDKGYKILGVVNDGTHFMLNGVACADCSVSEDAFLIWGRLRGFLVGSQLLFEDFGRTLDCELSGAAVGSQMCLMVSSSEVRLLELNFQEITRGSYWSFLDVHRKLGSGGEHLVVSSTHVYVLLNAETGPFIFYKFLKTTLALESVHTFGELDS